MQITRTTRRAAFTLLTAVGAVVIWAWQDGALAQMAGHGHGMHQHGAGGMMGHDMANMPGLRGLDATDQESAELAVMFQNFTKMSRTVENLPNGIRTVTGASDPEVMDALMSHVAGMIARVEQGRDPQIFIQSPTLDIFFARGGKLNTVIDYTDAGIVVTQTSTDPELVAALHAHAAEVTAMVDRGMAAVHEMMMGARP
jgi:hypothetical protein